MTLENGSLTVRAANSDLSQILREVSRLSGMRIDGAVADSRVFGLYGPQRARDVLTDLLRGTGSNFMMVGSTREGTPQQLLLTAKTGGPTPSNATPSETSANAALEKEPLGPGAVADGPPTPVEDDQARAARAMKRLETIQKGQSNQQ